MRLETAHLILREWIDSDLEPFAQMGTDPDVMRYFPKPLSREESKNMMARVNKDIAANGFGFWAAEVKETSEFIGFIGLHQPNFEAPFMPCTEIGWRLKKSAWGKGYATEGAKRCLEFAFQDLGLKEVLSFTAELNKPSMKVMERIGMKRDLNGDFNHPKVPDGHPLQKHVLYRIKDEQWK